MTPVRAFNVKALLMVASSFVLTSLGACGNDEVRTTCDEPQAYQAVVAGKHVVVPDELDPLDNFKEMPIPKAETAPRPEGSDCIENPPPILPGGEITQ